MNTTTTNARLFVLEDDKDLLAEIIDLAGDCRYEVVHARSVEEALEKTRAEEESGRPIHLALIDMMVPATQENCSSLDTLLEKRTKYILDRPRRDVGDFNEAEINEARQHLFALDRQIQMLVKFDGGLEFLEKALAQGLLSSCKVAVFSARANSDKFTSVHLKLGPRWAGLKQKPLDPDVLIDLLNKVRG